MINPECLINFQSRNSKGVANGFVVRRLPVQTEWGYFLAELADELTEQHSFVVGVVFTSVQPLP